MKTDSQIRMQGMQALMSALGVVEAERFVASLSRDRFDYTEWRRHGLPERSIAELARDANHFAGQSQQAVVPPSLAES